VWNVEENNWFKNLGTDGKKGQCISCSEQKSMATYSEPSGSMNFRKFLDYLRRSFSKGLSSI